MTEIPDNYEDLPGCRNQRIELLSDMAKRATWTTIRQRALTPNHFEELLSYAYEGAIKAVDKYDPEKGSFAGFAWSRMMFSLMDGVRDIRGVRAGEDDKIVRLRPDTISTEIEGMPELSVLPEDVWQVENRETVAQILHWLPADQRDLINDYYFGGRTLAEIGVDHGVSESRILQKLKIALHSARLVATADPNMLEDPPVSNSPSDLVKELHRRRGTSPYGRGSKYYDMGKRKPKVR